VSIKQIVGPDLYEKTRGALQAAFPDNQSVVTDGHVDVALQVAAHEWKAPDLAGLNIPTPTTVVPSPTVPPDSTFSFYVANALHARQGAPHSKFTGHLPLVRMSIPEHGNTQNLSVLHSPGGDMLPTDRLYASIDVLWGTYGTDPIFAQRGVNRPERIDFIGAPRLSGARFAAISLYLCYAHKADTKPSFYILEAGLATGRPRMPYLARTMTETLTAFTQYEPTSFSKKSHVYTANLSMLPDGEPDTLLVKVYERMPPNGPPDQNYINVTVQYEKRPTPVLTNPFHLTIEAGARVQAIADALGVPSNLDQQWFLKLIAHLNMSSLFSTPPT
jgi:hypothetical protein